MKTFEEKDLITFTNRHTVKVGDKGYFARSITDLNNHIKAGQVYELMSISDNNNWCFSDGTFYYGFFLPVDAVKENKPKEKKYRPFKDLYEFYKFLFPNSDFTREDFTQDMLLNVAFTYREKDKQYYTVTELITKVECGTIGGCNILCVNTRVVEYWFNKYEIINDNGEWQPFGVLENE